MKYIYLILFNFFLIGCQPAPDLDLCGDFDCSGHGQCVVVVDSSGTAAPTCRCDSGDSPTSSGWLCLPDKAETSLCDKVTCSGVGTCVSVAGAARCLCNTGYTLGADGKSCTDPCASVTCDKVGTCQRTSSGPRCACNAGYRTSADGKSCISTMPAGLTTYQFTYDGSTYQAGKVTLDTSKQSSGEIVERTRMTMGFDYYGRGLYRTSWQKYTLDSAGTSVTAWEVDRSISQGKVSRRRWTGVTYAGGKATVQQQRLDKTYTRSFSYSGKPPIPMAGGEEFPGWTLGCFSPTFYRLLFSRYGKVKAGKKAIPVLLPHSGTVKNLTVTSHANWMADRPVLGIPDLDMEVAYDAKGWPSKIWLTSQKMSWTPYSGTPADLNLGPRKAATTVKTGALPTAHTNKSVSFSSSDGVQLYGVLSRPKNATVTGDAAVLLVSGMFGRSRDEPYLWMRGVPVYGHLAAHLASAGYVVLRYDPRGRGSSRGTASTATLSQLTADAAAGLAYLAKHSSVDAKKIFVLSHGYGALVAAPLLKGSTKVAGYIGISPVLANVQQALYFGATDHIKAAGFSSRYMDNQKVAYNEDFAEIKNGRYDRDTFGDTPVAQIRELLSASALADVTAFSGPVLLLRGDQDMVVPGAQLTDAAAAAKKASKTNLTTTTLKGRTFALTEGKRSDLWEAAFLPLTLATDSVKALTDWLSKQ